MAETTEVITLFPTFVWKVQLAKDDYEAINRKVKAKLHELTDGMMRQIPRGEKLQTDQNLHTLEEFRELCDCIRNATTGVLEYLKVEYDEFEITGCWANISAVGERHRLHSHPNNYLSGVYYVQAQPGADTISFEDPRPQINVISPRVREYVPENAWEMHVGVKEGQLVLFPAWLPHSVAKNTSDKERISVSFNIMFPNFGRTMSAPKWRGNVPTPHALSRKT